ncbi:hypothetical protein FHX82_003828 [Amycolatopsis bartoniae]|uniref:PPM-type phosphatase domain-containing protein n=1 Tax=Amycolatopsis bartoniae TaxID=941986 RepID=A0A8H9MD74_9PSEU|nr:hypothetical protein [Amycolatopsis bartoniae]MBB2936764.1 hypothetical protein [Amycolatopsis bartoniae]TVT09187.1 hypothetical protein FNH07_09825 [Amycolatopsis bartoniae]GHF49959.1 hypothetical protein GCM10017566_23780 [Amycolatopsis bartoniae]
MIEVVESVVVPKSDHSPCADRLIAGPATWGVADGATAKPWDDPRGPDGAILADAVSTLLANLPRGADFAEAVRAATAEVAEMLAQAGIRPGRGSAVSFCVLQPAKRQIWRVGEARVMIDGRPVPTPGQAEDVVATARALAIESFLAAGETPESLRDVDRGRAAVEPLLRSLVELRNSATSRFAHAAIDGNPVPDHLTEIIPLRDGDHDIVIATDGYVTIAPTLGESEKLLAGRIERDPLMIEEPTATKGVGRGANSFDDRAYIRVRLSGDT